jgi:hypothetical protein
MHLATHGMKQNPDGTYGWKFDPYLRARPPYRLSLEDHIGLWSRIASLTLQRKLSARPGHRRRDEAF